MERTHVWDYIIIGAGSAGCVLANKLSASGDKSVLLVEAGGSDNALGLKVPSGIAFGNTSVNNDWGYQCQPDPTRNGKSEAWKRGRVVGGSSSINGTIYVRGNPADYDRWAALGNYGWSAKDVMPLFKAMENCDNKSSAHGNEGPLHVHVKTDKEIHPVTRSFIKAACHSGIPFNQDYNDEEQEGISYLQVTQKRGIRCSSSVAFLKPAMSRKNLTVETNATVHKVLTEDNRAVGIRFEAEGIVKDVNARDVIVVNCISSDLT